jgi:hypothetical protein
MVVLAVVATVHQHCKRVALVTHHLHLRHKVITVEAETQMMVGAAVVLVLLA